MKITSLNDQVEISEDKTLRYLQELKGYGYDTVTFTTHANACPKCRSLDGFEWNIDSFIKQSTVPMQDRFQGAPFFSHFHPDASGKIIVSGEISEGSLKEIILNYSRVLNPNDVGELESESVPMHREELVGPGNFRKDVIEAEPEPLSFDRRSRGYPGNDDY